MGFRADAVPSGAINWTGEGAARMISCPYDQQLRALLDERLDPAEENSIVGHVDACSRCQDRLEELTRSGAPHLSWIQPATEWFAEYGVASRKSGRIDDTRAARIPPAHGPDSVNVGAVNAAQPGQQTTIREGTQTEGEVIGESPAPTEIDLQNLPDRLDAGGTETQPIPDEEVSGVPMPPTEIDLLFGEMIDVEATLVNDEDRHQDGDRTVSMRDPSGRVQVARRDRSRADRTEIPGYEILEKLGEGGMGVVYKARQQALNRLVALKMIVGGSRARADLLGRFRTEAEAVARLRHPNILQIYDIGDVGGLPFLSLELLEGGDLDDRLAGTPQPGERAAELVATLARAIHAAHQARIVHRDLKPTNILFTADGVPKITDFGLAKRLESETRQTETGEIMGSPSYMAPEQAQGRTKDIGPAADVYALGAILYEVLTGRPPFKGETALETARQVIDDDPVPPSRLVPRLARDLETICLKCLHKEPHKRYDSALDLALDLECYREGKTIKARRTPPWERGLKWSKRHPVADLAVAMCLMAAVGLFARHLMEKARHQSRVLRDQGRGAVLLDQADQAHDRDQLERVNFGLTAFLEQVAGEAELNPISVRVAEKRQWAVDQLQAMSTRAASLERERGIQDRMRLDRDLFQRFLERRAEAQLYAAATGMLASSERLQQLLASAREALAIYARDPRSGDDAWILADPLPATLSKTQKTRVRDGCYDLLLLMSGAVRPAEGLRILDRAARLRPQATAAYHFRRGDCLERAGDLAGRDREQRAAGQLQPLTALDHFFSGRELAARGRFDDAIRLLDTAVQRDVDQTSAHLLLAICHLNRRPPQLTAARASLNSCIRSNPDLVGLYLLRASILGEQGSQAQGKDASDAYEAAETDYRHALGMKRNEHLSYSLLANRGLLRLRSGRLAEAIADLDAAIQIQPRQYQAHATLAQVLQRQGRLNDAASALGGAIACHPEPNVLAALYRTRALIYAPRRTIPASQRDSALRDLEQSIGHEPDPVQRASDHVWRARLFFGGGRSEQALSACDAALGLVPDDPDAHRVRLSALMKLRRYQDVLSAADGYLAGGKPIAEIFEIRGVARQARGDQAAAIVDFHRALELTPESERARRSRLLNRRGWAYQFADAPRLAVADFAESLQLNPDQADAYGGRGLARIRLGDWRAAVADAETGIRQAEGAGAGSTEEEVRDLQVQTLFNAARIYAQAVEYAVRDVRSGGERAVTLYRTYRSRAQDLLAEMLKLVPDPERREEILADPALRTLRLGPSRRPRMDLSSLSENSRGR
jgi:tetratricopeptide (TPR) repeat protein/tRNA A-37 threonylcarbamoyl transferase component Bud32